MGGVGAGGLTRKFLGGAGGKNFQILGGVRGVTTTPTNPSKTPPKGSNRGGGGGGHAPRPPLEFAGYAPQSHTHHYYFLNLPPHPR